MQLTVSANKLQDICISSPSHYLTSGYLLRTPNYLAWISSDYFESLLLPQYHLNRQAVNAVQWRHYSLTFALNHAKSKTQFSSGKSRNIVWKCLHDTALLYFFNHSSWLTFKLSTACRTTLNRLYWSNSVAIPQWNKHTHGTLCSKTKRFPLIEKKLFGS